MYTHRYITNFKAYAHVTPWDTQTHAYIIEPHECTRGMVNKEPHECTRDMVSKQKNMKEIMQAGKCTISCMHA